MTIGYLRVSTRKQNPENQRDEIRRFVEEKGMSIDRWVVEVVSGKTDENRRKLGFLLKKLHRGDTIVITEISRLSRNLTNIMSIMGRCLESGIHLYTTKERYVFDDSINSKVLCFAFGLVAEIERNLISMRTREALALRKAEGVKLGRKKGSCVKQEVLKENAERIETMRSSGCTVAEICRAIGVSRDTFYRYLAKQDQ